MIRRITMVTDQILRVIYLLSHCSHVFIRRITMITDIFLRIIDWLPRFSNVLIRLITLITDIILRIIDLPSQCLTFQRPRKFPEAMRK